MKVSSSAARHEILLKGLEVRVTVAPPDINVAYVNGRYATFKPRTMAHAVVRVFVRGTRHHRAYEAREALAVSCK